MGMCSQCTHETVRHDAGGCIECTCRIEFGAVARASALAAGDPDWMNVTSWPRQDDSGVQKRSCPDDGACHHGCTVGCFRVQTCAPLSAARYPGDRWPDEVVAANTPSDGHL